MLDLHIGNGPIGVLPEAGRAPRWFGWCRRSIAFAAQNGCQRNGRQPEHDNKTLGFQHGRVAELADARDLKSRVRKGRAGSSPASAI